MAIIINRTSSLGGMILPEPIPGRLYMNENKAHRFVISCTRDGSAVYLTGGVSGRFMRADGQTILLAGSVESGNAVVTLPQSCYVVPGRYLLTVYNTAGNVTTAIYAATGDVARTDTEELVDPGTVVPTIDNLLAEIDGMRAATAEANAAADNALGNFAGEFSPLTDYTAGDIVSYTDGKVYRFTADHTAGAWSTSDVMAVTVADEVGRLEDALGDTFGTYYQGPVADGARIVAMDNLQPGDLVYYSISAQPSFAGRIVLYDASDNPITYVGKTSSSGEVNDYSGVFYIPEGYAYTAVEAKRGTGTTERRSTLTIKWLSPRPPLYMLEDAFRRERDYQSGEGFIRGNAYTMYARYYSSSGLTIQPLPCGDIQVTGTATNTVKWFIGTVALEAGAYIVDGFGEAIARTGFVIQDGTNLPVFGPAASGTFTVDAAVTLDVYLYVYTGTEIDRTVTPRCYRQDTLSNRELTEQVGHIAPIIRDEAYYDRLYLLKARTSALEGYTYAGFSSGLMVNGVETYVTRLGHTHVTPADKTRWGKLVFHRVDRYGVITHQLLDADYSALSGELRDPNLSRLRDGSIILSAFTTVNSVSPAATSSCMFLLDDALNIVETRDNIISDGSVVWGNTLQTPEGYLLKVSYMSGVGINLYRSTAPFNGLSGLTFSRATVIESGNKCSECTIGYVQDRLVCLVREEDTAAHIYVTEDLEGTDWPRTPLQLTDKGLLFELHSPVLMPYWDSRHVFFGGSQNANDRAAGRPPMLGYFDLDTGRIITWCNIKDDEVSASGYPGIAQLSASDFGVVYYCNRSMIDATRQSSLLYYARVNVHRALNMDYV